MTVMQALVLGVVQGIGEFLPVSSSAHLVLVPWALGWEYAGLTFDVALHMGTLVAVLAFFWRDWLNLAGHAIKRRTTDESKMFWYIVAATVPGGAAGFLLEKQAETVFRTPVLIGVMLMAMGVILHWVDRRAARRKDLWGISFSDAMFIGVSQALAIIPGVSRSGITMTAGRFRGLTRETAARYSFLLSTPIIVGAGIFKLKDLSMAVIDAAFITGVISSAVVGFLSISFLLKYLSNRSFAVFVWYRLLAGAAVIVLAYTR